MNSPENHISQTEFINALIHIAGVLFGIIFIPLLLIKIFYTHGTVHFISVLIYGSCFMLTFLLSSLYHLTIKSRREKKFNTLDELSIYFFIAGTYTPLVMVFNYNYRGLIILLLVWVFIPVGITYKLLSRKKPYIHPVFLYVLQGLLFVFFYQSFFLNMPATIIKLVIAGVALYLAGIIFFLWRKWKYNHALWHLFVLSGSICHYIAIYQSFV